MVRTGKVLKESIGLRRQVTLKNGIAIEKLMSLQLSMSRNAGRIVSLEEVINRIVEFAYEQMKGELEQSEKTVLNS